MKKQKIKFRTNFKGYLYSARKVPMVLPKLCWDLVPRALVLILLLGPSLSTVLASTPTQAYIGALPVPGTSQTSEYLALNQHGTILENDQVSLEWESNGNLVVYFYGHDVIWSSNTGGKGNILAFQKSDGKLVIKNSGGSIIWSSSGTGGNLLKIQADRNLVLLNSSGQKVWQTNTAIAELKTAGLQTIQAHSDMVQDFAIPANPGYQYLYLRVEGADGGKKQVKEVWGTTRFTVKAGAGATIKGTFEIGTGTNMIPPGSVVRFIVGKKGATRTGQTTAGSSGGAGTAVLVKKPNSKDWHLLMVAGGGGGAYSDCCTDKNEGKQAEVGESGSGGGGKNGGTGGTNGGYGKNGSKTGTVGIGAGGGGAFGEYTGSTWNASIPGTPGWKGGKDDASALPTGGGGSYAFYGVDGPWGFGGGGGGGPSGGGGGGYSGGGSGSAFEAGGGGGSYLNTDYAVGSAKTQNGTTSDTQDGFAEYKFTNNGVITTTIWLAKDQAKCIDVTGGNTADGTNIELWDCNGGGAQDWVYEDLQIKLAKSMNKCLDLKSSNTSNGTNIQLWSCNGTSNQKWIYDGAIKAFRSGLDFNKCLDLGNGQTTNGNNIQLWDCGQYNDNQKWLIDGATTPQTDAMVKTIRPYLAQNKCVDLTGGVTADYTNIQLWNCGGVDEIGNQSQLWYFDGLQIKLNKDLGKCLDLSAGNTANSTNIQLYHCHSNDNQKWIYDGITRSIRSAVDPNKCIDVVNGWSANGTNIQLWDCVGVPAQQFVLNSPPCIEDITPPVAKCKDVTFSRLTAPVAADIDDGSYDNCSISSMSLGWVSGNTWKLIVEDPSGNASSCTATVTNN